MAKEKKVKDGPWTAESHFQCLKFQLDSNTPDGISKHDLKIPKEKFLEGIMGHIPVKHCWIP